MQNIFLGKFSFRNSRKKFQKKLPVEHWFFSASSEFPDLNFFFKFQKIFQKTLSKLVKSPSKSVLNSLGRLCVVGDMVYGPSVFVSFPHLMQQVFHVVTVLFHVEKCRRRPRHPHFGTQALKAEVSEKVKWIWKSEWNLENFLHKNIFFEN